MVSFYMSELTLVDNPHKNQVVLTSNLKFQLKRYVFLHSYNSNFSFQGQTLISVGGDVVFVTYFSGNDHVAH